MHLYNIYDIYYRYRYIYVYICFQDKISKRIHVFVSNQYTLSFT